MLLNNIMDMYFKCNDPQSAHQLFKEMRSQSILDQFSWTTVISGLCDLRLIDTAFHRFDEMQQFGVSPSAITWDTLIAACADTLDDRTAIHRKIEKSEFIKDQNIVIQLIRMYGKCNQPITARKIFDSIRGPSRSSKLWNVIISVSDAQVASSLYDEMTSSRTPSQDVISMMGVCAKEGLVEK